MTRIVKRVSEIRLYPRHQVTDSTPSVSVCIPARNETHALAECLERVLASSYPKLEILVLDDNSKDDTSLIIKSFAHAGVRFISGQKLPEGWLGKNFALEQLGREASGSYIVFMDVDTFIQPHTIDSLVAHMDTNKRHMISVLPRRNDKGRASVLFGTLRYFFQLTNWWSKTPPVSSSLWMIRREVLRAQLGGFEQCKDAVEPEGVLALYLKQHYSWLLSSDEFNVSYEKKWLSQIETSKRLVYPLFGQTWIGGLSGALLLLVMGMPVYGVVFGLLFGEFVITISALFVSLIYIGLYAVYLRWFWHQSWWLGAFLWPYAITQEFILLIVSAIGYAKGTITWKGRSVKL